MHKELTSNDPYHNRTSCKIHLTYTNPQKQKRTKLTSNPTQNSCPLISNEQDDIIKIDKCDFKFWIWHDHKQHLINLTNNI